MAPERSSRSGNVASTIKRRTSVRTDPNKLVNTPSRYIELLAIASTSEISVFCPENAQGIVTVSAIFGK